MIRQGLWLSRASSFLRPTAVIRGSAEWAALFQRSLPARRRREPDGNSWPRGEAERRVRSLLRPLLFFPLFLFLLLRLTTFNSVCVLQGDSTGRRFTIHGKYALSKVV